MIKKREILEGEQEQGATEEYTYRLKVSDSVGVPTGTPVVKGFTADDKTKDPLIDVTTTIFPTGTASLNGQYITLPKCKAMTANLLYRITITYSLTTGDVRVTVAYIRCTP